MTYLGRMSGVRPLLALVFSVILTVTAQGLAFARGQAPAEGRMILCTGQGAVTIFTDADGRPTSPPQLCADGALALFALSPLKPVEPICPTALSDPGQPMPPGTRSPAGRPALSARDPPQVWC